MEITLIALQYLHLLGMIIGMGAAIVIETFGFISRKSSFWTGVTIDAHYVTKPLIWLGTLLFAITWLLMMKNNSFIFPYAYKTILILILFINGSYLSFFVSPRLIKHKKEYNNTTLPASLQLMIIPSALISSIGWFTMILLTILFWI